MKKILLLMLLCGGSHAWSQATDSVLTAHNFLDTNNIKTRVNALGDMWWDPVSGVSYCEYPAGSGKHVATAGALWISAYDPGGALHVAAQTYRQSGLDYWTGPTHLGGDSLAGAKWGRVWKITKSEIHEFLSQSTHTLENTPASILEWPAKNNPYAKGAGGVSLMVIGEYAPFVDADGDGSYNPLMGDYPAMKGDQMLWNIFTDAMPVHGESGGEPLAVTVYQSSYAYSTPGVLSNIIFYEYDVLNRSNKSYDSFRLSFMADLDLGYGFDDYVGFDSARRMGIIYNGSDTDAVYGVSTIPAVALAILQAPGDSAGVRLPVSFTMYNNDASTDGNPQTPEEFNHYMRGRNRSGAWQHYDSLYQIDWSVPGGAGYACTFGIPPADTRFLISTHDTTFAAGSIHKYVFALIVSADAGGCPETDFTGIADAADSAIIIHWQPTGTGIAHQEKKEGITLYPNPAGGAIHFTTGRTVQQVSAVNTLGQSVALPFRQENEKIVASVSELPTGVYTLSVKGSDFRMNAVFVKQ